VIRVPGAGNVSSKAADRIVIHAEPDLFGRLKFPRKMALGCSAMTSPGCAAFSAVCKSPPAPTAMVRPDGAV